MWSGLSLGVTPAMTAMLSPFSSFPAILGHEVVAVVEEAGTGADVATGQRVVLDPIISCAVRGLDPCPGCRAGTPALCRRAAEGDLSPGMLIGFCRDLPGGWSEGMLAHSSQLHAVPKQLSDEAAALIEPLACGLHADGTISLAATALPSTAAAPDYHITALNSADDTAAIGTPTPGLAGPTGSEIVPRYRNGEVGTQAKLLPAGIAGKVKAFPDVLAGQIEERLGRLQDRGLGPRVAGLRERQ